MNRTTTTAFYLCVDSRVTREMGFHSTNFGLPGPLRCRVGRGTRQTDGRTHRASFYNVPPTEVWGIII